MKFSLIVPMYNEAAIVVDTARTYHNYLSAHQPDFELIFVDDGSSDDCGLQVEALDLPKVQVLRYTPNQGKGNAVKEGMLAASGDIRMFLDADIAYGTDVILQVTELFTAHPEKSMIIGSRPLHPEGYAGYTPIRKLASRIYIKVLNMVGGFQLSDSQCGCKAFRSQAAEDIFSRMKTSGFAFDFEAILWAQKLGYGILEMPVKIVNHRESKVNVIRDTFKMLGELRRIKSRLR